MAGMITCKLRSEGFLCFMALVGALLACKGDPGQQSASTAESASQPKSESVKPARFAKLSLSDLEAKAKKANWDVVSSSSESGEGGASEISLELDDGKHYAYVSVVSLPTPSKKQVAKVEGNRSVHIYCFDDDEGVDVGKILKETLKKPLAEATADSIKAALTKAGWKVESSANEYSDGLAISIFGISSKGRTVLVNFVDASDAAKAKRYVADGLSYMVVHVCKDCTKRNRKGLSKAWQDAKAERLMNKLAR